MWHGRDRTWAKSLSIKKPDERKSLKPAAGKETHPEQGELVKIVFQRERHNKNYLSQPKLWIMIEKKVGGGDTDLLSYGFRTWIH